MNTSAAVKKQSVPPGHFKLTVQRDARFMSGFAPDREIRYVTPDGIEWTVAARYEHEGVVFVDLVPVEYER
jgi:hypothetical protein